MADEWEPLFIVYNFKKAPQQISLSKNNLWVTQTVKKMNLRFWQFPSQGASSASSPQAWSHDPQPVLVSFGAERMDGFTRPHYEDDEPLNYIPISVYDVVKRNKKHLPVGTYLEKCTRCQHDTTNTTLRRNKCSRQLVMFLSGYERDCLSGRLHTTGFGFDADEFDKLSLCRKVFRATLFPRRTNYTHVHQKTTTTILYSDVIISTPAVLKKCLTCPHHD